MQADELPPPAQMVLLLGGFRISQALYAAAALGVADQLATGPQPQPGLSRAISSASARMACAERGRPGTRRRYAQRFWTRSACQRSTVRGETIRRSCRRRPLGSSRASADKTARSAQDSFGDLTWRWRTATW
jgi:hypothetical protein